jgi:hypothetical protein
MYVDALCARQHDHHRGGRCTNTCRCQLSGSFARGTRHLDQIVQAEPTPQTPMAFERELNALLREVGRRIVAWALNRLEPEDAAEAPPRAGVQVAQLVNELEQARASKRRLRPTRSVGRDGLFVPLRHGVWQEGAGATSSVRDRRGKRLGSVELGQIARSGSRHPDRSTQGPAHGDFTSGRYSESARGLCHR